MNEITRRDVLKWMSATLPALALAESALLTDSAATAQEISAGDLANFVKLSAVLTGHPVTDLNPRLAMEYYRRLHWHLKNVGHEGALQELLIIFGQEGTNDGPVTPAQEQLVEDIMADPAYHCPQAAYQKMTPMSNPNNNEAIRLINEARELINGWTQVNPYDCETVVEVISVQPCDAPDWTKEDVYPFICQEITAVWYMSAIYRQAAGMINVTPTGQIVPADSFHYGSAKGYVSGLVWDTVGGHTHPYAQCGGEFGYWEKDPEP